MEPCPGWSVAHSPIGVTNLPVEIPLYGMPAEFTRRSADRLFIGDRQKGTGKTVRL